MKKMLIIICILAFILILVGCDPGIRELDGDRILRNTVKIELFDYENANPKFVRIGGDDTPTFDFSKATFIATLDKSYFEDIVKDMSEQNLGLLERTLNEPIGKTLILYQSNGNMMVFFSCVYENEKGDTKYYGQGIIFDENGMFVEYLGDVGSAYVDRLEEKYFQNTLETN